LDVQLGVELDVGELELIIEHEEVEQGQSGADEGRDGSNVELGALADDLIYLLIH